MTIWLNNPQKKNIGHYLPLSDWFYLPQYKGNVFKWILVKDMGVHTTALKDGLRMFRCNIKSFFPYQIK
jgi:hypothetical protein